MKATFAEDIVISLRKRIGGRVTGKRRFRCGENCFVEFLGEDNDVTTVDLAFEDGMLATQIPRHVVQLEK